MNNHPKTKIFKTPTGLWAVRTPHVVRFVYGNPLWYIYKTEYFHTWGQAINYATEQGTHHT